MYHYEHEHRIFAFKERYLVFAVLELRISNQQHKLISILFVYLEDTALYVYSGWWMALFFFSSTNILLINDTSVYVNTCFFSWIVFLWMLDWRQKYVVSLTATVKMAAIITWESLSSVTWLVCFVIDSNVF